MIPPSSATTRPRPQHVRRLAALVLPALLLATGLIVAAPAHAPTAQAAAAQTTRQPADRYPVRPVKPETCPKDTPATVTCGRIEVPVDWDRPGGAKGTVRIAVDRAKGLPAKARPLFLHAGGPGSSSYDFAVTEAAAGKNSFIRNNLRSRNAVVGLEQRGTGDSIPVRCLTSAEREQQVESTEETIEGTQETVGVQRADLIEQAKQFAQSCKEQAGAVLPHVTTWAAAQDMAYATRVLGADRADFLGFSYGTPYGATFSTLFPQRTGRFVLDSALGASWYGDSFVIDRQYVVDGQERVLNGYLEDCRKRGRKACPFGNGNPRQGLKRLMAKLDREPLKVNLPDGSTAPVDGAETLNFAGQFTADGVLWGIATTVLTALERGDVGPLQKLMTPPPSEQSERRKQRDTPRTVTESLDAAVEEELGQPTPETVEVPDNFQEAYQAITCADSRHSRNVADYDRFTRELRRAAPFFGSQVGAGYINLACAFWPAPAKRVTQPLQRGDELPALVVNSTLDPATPVEGARALASELRSPLITMQGVGHGLYGLESNTCVTRAADAYLIRGTLPAGSTTCRQQPQPSSVLVPPDSW